MATVTKGYTFVNNDVVTPTKLNNLVDLAKITNIANGDISDTAAIAHSKLASLPSGQVLVGSSTNVPTAKAITGDVTFSNTGATTIAALAVTEGKIGNNAVTNSKLRQSAARSVIGNSTNASANPADITAGTDGHVLRRSGDTIGFGTIASAALAIDAVTTAKIADGAVTNAKLGNDIVFVPAGAVMPFAMNSAPSGWLAADGTAVSRSTYSTLFAALVTNAGFSSQTFTVTIASPAVFTKTSHGFSGGEILRLSTTGALPTGLNTTSDYFVEVINANTFYLSATIGGTRINTSGTQNGTHSYVRSLYGLGNGSTTFNLPDLRGYFIRGFGPNSNGTASAAFGVKQADAMQGHVHLASTRAVSANNGNNFTGIPLGNADTVNGANTGGPISDGTNGTPRTAAETRPANIALLYCIKF